MPSKVNVFIEFLSELYGVEPYWEKNFDLESVVAESAAAVQAKRPRKKSA